MHQVDPHVRPFPKDPSVVTNIQTQFDLEVLDQPRCRTVPLSKWSGPELLLEFYLRDPDELRARRMVMAAWAEYTSSPWFNTVPLRVQGHTDSTLRPVDYAALPPRRTNAKDAKNVSAIWASVHQGFAVHGIRDHMVARFYPEHPRRAQEAVLREARDPFEGMAWNFKTKHNGGPLQEDLGTALASRHPLRPWAGTLPAGARVAILTPRGVAFATSDLRVTYPYDT